MLKVTDTEKDRLRRMQGVAGNIGLINPLVFNHFGYGTYAQVCRERERNTEGFFSPVFNVGVGRKKCVNLYLMIV